MHLVNLTTAGIKRFVGIIFTFFLFLTATAQDNSPYSRYGLGDILPNQNIINRGMGGIAIGYSDAGFGKIPKYDLSINFRNPASLGSLSNSGPFSNTIFDVAGEVDFRTLKSTAEPSKYTSINTNLSYLQLAFPISTAKMERKGINWGLSFGLRPINRIAYRVEKNERLEGIDSLNTLFEGSGGINQANISTGLKIKNFSIGISTGYTFGTRDFSTQKVFVNDTIDYYKSNTKTDSHFGGVFLYTGIQYMIKLKKQGYIKIGAIANLQQNLSARQDNINETFAFDGNGGIFGLDTVTSSKEVSGKVKLPATYGFGFTHQDSSNHWVTGLDFEFSNWSQYSYFGATENVQNSWVLRVGAEYYPAGNDLTNVKYFRFVKYRAGFYFGPDYVVIDKTRNNYAATLGASFPLTPFNFLNRGEFVRLNTALEVGGRGNKESFSFRETNVRFSIGISMNARWFQKRSYY